MANKQVTLKRVIDTSGNTDTIHPTTHWDQIEGKPSTFTPTSHTHSEYAKRIDLTSQVQLTSYRKSVIALCNLDNSSISRNSWSGGTIFFHRTNGLQAPVSLHITMEKRYNAEGANYTAMALSGNSFGDNIQYVKFDYNGTPYGGIEFFFSNAEHGQVYFIGEGNFDIFGLDYYNTQTSTALNTEVNNSISTTDMVAETDFFINNQKVFHEGNDGSTSGLDAQYLSGVPVGSFLQKTGGTMSGSIAFTNATDIGIQNSSANSWYRPEDQYGNTHIEVRSGKGIYVDADTIAFRSQANTDRMRINSSGNVGIGTTSPGAKLDVNGALYLKGRAFGDSDGTNSYLKAGTSGKIYFETNGGTRGGIDASGKFGIGTLSPTKELDVNGNIIVSGDNRYMTFGTPGVGTSTGGRFFSIEGNTDTSGEGSGRIFFTEHNSSTAAMDKYGMSLGYRGGATSIEGASGNTWSGLSQIGNGQWGMWGHNNSEAGALVMSGDRAATYIDLHNNELRDAGKVIVSNANPILQLNDTSTDANAYIDYQAGTSLKVHAGADPIVFIAGNSEKARLTAGNGNFGIGTTNPAEKLDVNGKIRANDNFEHLGSGGYYLYTDAVGFRGAFYDNGSVTSIYGDGNGSTPVININNDLVGIGTTSPGYNLDVVGNIRAKTGSSTKIWAENTTSGQSSLELKSTTTHMRLIGQLGGFQMYDQIDGASRFEIDTNGNSKIFGNLTIQSNFPRIFLTDTDDNSDYSIINSNGALKFYDDTNSAYRWTLLANGRVGIGTESPSQKLDVSGSVRASDNMYAARYYDLNNTSYYGDFGSTSVMNAVQFQTLQSNKTSYGEPNSENFYRLKIQNQGGTHNDVGIGQTASGNMGYNVTAANAHIFFEGTNGEIARFQPSGLALNHSGTGTVDSKAITFTSQFNNTDVSRDLKTNSSGALLFNGNALATEAYVTANAGGGTLDTTSIEIASASNTTVDISGFSSSSAIVILRARQFGIATATYVGKLSDITTSSLYKQELHKGSTLFCKYYRSSTQIIFSNFASSVSVDCYEMEVS